MLSALPRGHVSGKPVRTEFYMFYYRKLYSLLLPREWYNVLLCQAGQFSAFLFALGEWCDEVMNANLLLQFRDLSYLSQNPEFRTSVSGFCLKFFKPKITVITVITVQDSRKDWLEILFHTEENWLYVCLTWDKLIFMHIVITKFFH